VASASAGPDVKTTNTFVRNDRRVMRAAMVLGLIVAPLLMLAVTLTVRREFEHGRQLRLAVNHSFEERAQLQTVFSLMQDAETGQRGYALTGQERFLEPYNEAKSRLGPELARLRRLQATELPDGRAEQPQEPANQAELERLIAQKLANMSRTIEIRRTQGSAGASAWVAAGEGKLIMDHIRSVVARMTAEEKKSLDLRTIADMRRGERTERVTIGLVVALSLMLATAYFLVLRQARGRLLALERVRNSAARQSAIFEAAQDALITFNPSGTIEAINKAGEAMFGRDRADLNRRDLSLLLRLSSDDELFLKRMLGEGLLNDGLSREFIGVRSDGSEFPVEALIGGIRLPDGLHLVAGLRDITERRRVDQMKAEFISTVSHELRTPLTSIAGSLGLLIGGATGPLPDKAGRLISIAHSNCQRLVRLINDILDMEKIESGKMTFDMHSLDLGDLARRASDAMGGYAQEFGVTFDLDIPADLPPISGDADRLMQVASNLLSNASKFSPKGGTVFVTLERQQRRLRLTVRDQGAGVPANFRARIFSKFAQADASDIRQKGGTGLGLAITKEIVERHGGRLWFDSPPEGGAAFHVELPIVETTIEAATLGRRLLICDDDPDIAHVLRAMAEEEGFSADICSSLAEAETALATSDRFAALLLDVRLPDGSGLDLLRRLRANPETRSLPVLIVSAENLNGQAAALDVLEWMQKPISPGDLKAALTRVAEGDGKPLRVLHVEDDADLRQVVTHALGSRCDVVAADSLASARLALGAATPDLVILDIGLADGSGLDLLPDLLRADGSAIPVVIFSAQAVEGLGSDSGVSAVMTKSRTSLDQLAGMVRRVGRGARKAA
jgi:PAS domain S-box-containing protein